ncbi:MAG TPA: DNA primase [Verrucomicrobiae bacterium]|jgi:DNA primase|nr:DNA primase [Verrucomicrobiae bacterium]
MAGISPATLERIRAASDIVDIIGAYVPLKKAGANFTALCPFHKEKSPSFNVNPHKQIFHCFGCHKGGDVFTFVKDYENIGFVDAVRRLAERAKIPLEFDNNPAEQQSRHLKDQLLEIHEKITQRWQNCLLNEAAGQMARDYLAKRGVSADAIKLFRLGAAPELWDDTVNWAKSKNYELPLVEKAGLIIRKEETGNHYDRFRGRLMFPICDEQGRVIGFSGRILSGDEKTAKYVNSPETAIFTKSKIFFGLDKSKRAILDAGFAIICEGQLDLIACFMAGVQNVVAPQGTAFTDQHARILKRYVNEAVLCFDSDEAGQNAAVRSLDHLLASGLAVRVAVVPAPHDPDSFIKKFGGEKFRELISKADGFFDYYLNRLCKQNDTASDKGRAAILRAMAEAVHKTGSAVLIDTYAQKTALRLGVSTESVRAEFKKNPVAKPAATENEDEIVSAERELPRPSSHELHLLRLLLLHDELIAWAALHIDVDWIQNSLARQIVEQRFAAQANETWRTVGAFLDSFEIFEARNLVTEVAAEDRKIPNPEQQLADMVLKLRNQFLDRQIASLTQKAGQPELSDSEKIELLREQQKLREQKRSPLPQLIN